MSKCAVHPAAGQSGICCANGIDINYRRTGGGGAPLVALHGLIGSGACLSPLARALDGAFDVVLPDARGHGGSSAPDKGYLYDDLAGDVVGLIAALALDAPILLGHSMGGMTAAVVAAGLGSATKALVLIEPTFISPTWQREVFKSDVAAEHRQSLRSTRQDLLVEARVRNPNRSPEIVGHLVDARLQTSVNAFEVLTPPNPDWRKLITDIAVPMLLVLGDRGIVSIETARELGDLNPLLRYELISEAGHGLPYDEPEQLGAVVSAFLAEVTAVESGVTR